MPAATAQIVFSGETRDVQAALDAIESRFGKTDQTVNSLTGSLKRLAVVYVSLASVQKLLELGKLGESVISVRNAFNQLAGGAANATRLLEQARAAVNGTVSDLELMRTVNEALRRGLPFEQIVAGLKFAKATAEATGEDMRQIFESLVMALTKLNQGLELDVRTLIRLGIAGRTAAAVLANLKTKTEQLTAATMSGGDAFQKFDANLESLKQKLAVGVILKSGPLIDLLNKMLGAESKATVAPRTSPIPTIDDLAQWQPTSPEYDLAFQLYIAADRAEELEILLAAARQKLDTLTDGTTNLADGTAEYGAQLLVVKGILDEQADLQAKAAAAAAAAADQATQAARAAVTADQLRLQQERDLVKAKIANGQAVYEDLRELLDRQKNLYQDDINFQINLINDRAAVRANDQQQEFNRQSEILNATRRFSDALLEDDTRSRSEQLTARVALWRQTMQIENLDLEHRRQAYAELRSAETALTAFIQQEMQRRVQIMQTVFGQPFLAALDQIFTGGKFRFDRFLNDLTRSIARFLAQRLLLKFFASLAGGPLAGLFGPPLPGGGGYSPDDLYQAGYGPPAALPDPLSGLGGLITQLSRARTGADSARPASGYSTAAPASVTVQIVATAEQLAAIVQHGNHHRRKTDLTR